MQLIVNADDFGLTSGVNRGIIDCHLAGTVTSATLMVNMPATEEAAALAKDHPGLGVGLHFNLTLGVPLSAASATSSLVDRQGRFHRRSAAERLAIARRFKAMDIERELYAQLRRFEVLGLIPTHLDSHQHIHLFPLVFDELARLCAGQGLPLRIPWVAPQRGRGLRRMLRAWVLGRLVKGNVARWAGRIKVNAGFGSVFDRLSSPEELALETYRQILQTNAASPFELMVHPARADAELAGLTRIAGFSEREREILQDQRFVDLLASLGWQLTNYRDAFS